VSFRVAVLISGEGTNLQALLDTVHGRYGIEIVGVAASRVGAPGLERAARADVETAVFPIAAFVEARAPGATAASPEGGAPSPERGPPFPHERAARDRALGDWLEACSVDLVVLAGFMELLGPELIGRFRGRIINVHPALLPAFPGVDAIRQALDHGVKVTGVTIHFVDEGVDSGPIILQEAFPLPDSSTSLDSSALPYPRAIAEIEERVHGIEHRLLPRAVRLIAEGRVHVEEGNPRQVRIDPAGDGAS
jgi:phosphoribosylglycinamide formyltransferase-1